MPCRLEGEGQAALELLTVHVILRTFDFEHQAQFVAHLRRSRYTVAYTGAGISTAAGIKALGRRLSRCLVLS